MGQTTEFAAGSWKVRQAAQYMQIKECDDTVVPIESQLRQPGVNKNCKKEKAAHIGRPAAHL